MSSIIRNGFQIILLKGKMGSGKTHFVKEYMQKHYGFTGVSSPTYVFLNTYVVNNLTIGHFDCYQRIDYDILTDSLLTYDLIFIEWPNDKILKLLNKYVVINCENMTKEYFDT